MAEEVVYIDSAYRDEERGAYRVVLSKSSWILLDVDDVIRSSATGDKFRVATHYFRNPTHSGDTRTSIILVPLDSFRELAVGEQLVVVQSRYFGTSRDADA